MSGHKYHDVTFRYLIYSAFFSCLKNSKTTFSLFLVYVTLCITVLLFSINRLKHILQIHDISVLGYSISKLKNDHAKHNMTVLHKNGYVTGISKAQLPPSWVISAMRYLAKCKYSCFDFCDM